MNTIILTALSAAALLPAAPPVAPIPVQSVQEQPVKGKILVLTNERTVEGDVERIDDRYRVCRPVGETWIEGAQVLRLCASPEEAYAFLRTRISKANYEDQLVRLAEWCLDHGLTSQALTETQLALTVNKNHPQAKRLLARLQIQQVPGSSAPLAPRPELPEPPPSPQLDLTAEALNLFGTRIQPILMNACANCHNEAHRRPFRLTRTYEIGVGNRTILHQNVSAVLAYVNLSQPQTSSFLTKAMTAHWCHWTAKGMVFEPGDPSQPAIQNRNAPAYRALEDWVRLAVSTSPQGAEMQVAEPPTRITAPEPRTVPVTPVETVAPGTDSLPRKVETTPSVPMAPMLIPPAPSPSLPDAYDPAEFNRRNHPDRVKPNETPPESHGTAVPGH